MASSAEYLEYVLDLLREVEGIRYRKMMGEYLLYQDGTLFGGVYDDRLLLKNVPALSAEGLACAIPYPGAKPMMVVDSEEAEEVARLVRLVVQAGAK